MSMSSDVDGGAHEFASITNDARSLNLLPFGGKISRVTGAVLRPSLFLCDGTEKP